METENKSYLIRKLIIFVISIIFASPMYANDLFADSLFTSGVTSRPHQIFSNSELLYYHIPSYDGTRYWIVNSANLDELILDDENFWGLLYNDFYRYYHDADINVSTDLKKKNFEKSDLFEEFRNDMNFERNLLISDTIHMPLHRFANYKHEYDVNKGGFHINEELDYNLPPFLTNRPNRQSKEKSKYEINFGNEPNKTNIDRTYEPKYFKIPSSLKGKIESFENRYFSFFMPIANEEIALQIEDMCLREDIVQPSENSFELLIQFHYIQAKTPFIELVDVILLRIKDQRIIWTLSKGDLSINK